MGWLDIVLLDALALWLIATVIYLVRRRGKGCGACGNCIGCENSGVCAYRKESGRINTNSDTEPGRHDTESSNHDTERTKRE